MRFILIYAILISSPTLAQDSLKLISIPKWKVGRLLDVYFYDHPTCTLAVNQSKYAIDSLKFALTEGQTLITLRTQERDLKVSEAEHLRQALKHSEAETKLTKQNTKKEKKKSFRKGTVVGAIIVTVGRIGVKLLFGI